MDEAEQRQRGDTAVEDGGLEDTSVFEDDDVTEDTEDTEDAEDARFEGGMLSPQFFYVRQSGRGRVFKTGANELPQGRVHSAIGTEVPLPYSVARRVFEGGAAAAAGAEGPPQLISAAARKARRRAWRAEARAYFQRSGGSAAAAGGADAAAAAPTAAVFDGTFADRATDRYRWEVRLLHEEARRPRPREGIEAWTRNELVFALDAAYALLEQALRQEAVRAALVPNVARRNQVRARVEQLSEVRAHSLLPRWWADADHTALIELRDAVLGPAAAAAVAAQDDEVSDSDDSDDSDDVSESNDDVSDSDDNESSEHEPSSDDEDAGGRGERGRGRGRGGRGRGRGRGRGGGGGGGRGRSRGRGGGGGDDNGGGGGGASYSLRPRGSLRGGSASFEDDESSSCHTDLSGIELKVCRDHRRKHG